MGYALAMSAIELGHEVVLISGPTILHAPKGLCAFVKVTTAEEMYDATLAYASDADLIIMTAAVADYTPAQIADQKIKKGESEMVLRLVKTKDILGALGERKTESQCLVGFAAETQNLDLYAKDKLKRKHLDFIAANDVSGVDSGFDVDQNAITLFAKSGKVFELALQPKRTLADELLKIIFTNSPILIDKA